MSFNYTRKNVNYMPVAFEESGNKKITVYYDDDINNEVFIDKDKITDEVLREVYTYDELDSQKKRNKKRDELYNKLTEKNYKHITNYLSIDSGKSKYFPIPWVHDTGRDCIYISGVSGGGKSYFTNKMIFNWKKHLGAKKIYVIAPPKNEATYGKLANIDDFVKFGSGEHEDEEDEYNEMVRIYKENKIRFKHKKKLLKDEDPDALMELEIMLENSKPPTKAEFNKKKSAKAQKFGLKLTPKFEKIVNSLFVFDDWEIMNESDQRKCEFLINYLLEGGRKDGNSIVIIRHRANAGAGTARMIAECNSFVIFSKTLPRNNRYLLEKYLELDKEQIHRILQLFHKRNPHRSRWAFINRSENMVISEKKIMLI